MELRKTKLATLVGLLLSLALLCSTWGCATPTRTQYDHAAVLGTAGAAAGALLDKKNPWRGAVVGGAIGAAAGWGL